MAMRSQIQEGGATNHRGQLIVESQGPPTNHRAPLITMTKLPFNEKTLQSIRMNSKAIVDIEASDRSHRTLADDNQRQMQNFLKHGQCIQLNSTKANSYPPLIEEEEETEELPMSRLASTVISKRRTGGKNGNGTSQIQSCLGGEPRSTSPSFDHSNAACDQQEMEEIQNLSNLAAGYALRGDEDTAVKIYKKALAYAMIQVEKIQKRMVKSETEPDYLKATIFQLLREKWTEITSIIAEIKTMMSIIHERNGDYDRAIKACKEAKDVYERHLGRDSKNYSNIFSSAADSVAMMVNMAEKLVRAQESLAARTALHEEALRIHEKIASAQDASERENLYSMVFEKLSAALALEVKSLGEHHPHVADTLAFLSKVHLEKDDIAKALMSMQRSVSVAEISLGAKHPRTGQKYYDLGRQFDLANRDKYDKAHALLYYRKALETFIEAEGDNYRNIGSVSNDLGVLLLKDRKYEEAISKFNESLMSYDNCPKADEDLIHADTAQVWRNLAECYMLQKDWSTAVLKFSSALSVQREARRILEATTGDASPDIPSLIQDENIADTMKRLGKAYTALKEYDKAENILLEALTIFQNACMAFKATSTESSPLILASKQDSIANILFCLAEVKEASQHHHEAIQLYDESLTLRLYSDEVRPNGEKLNNLPIAMCLAGIGNARMSRGEYGMAHRAFTEAIQSAKKDSLPGHHPIIQTLNEKSRAAAIMMVQQEECGAADDGMVDHEKSDQTKNNPKLENAGTPKSRNSHPVVLEAIESLNNDEFSDDDGENDGENRQIDLESLNEEGTGTKSCAPNFSAWFDPVVKLERKVKAKRKRGDIPGAVRFQDRIVEFRRAHLLKKQEEMKPRSKESRDLAKSLVDLARLQSFIGATKLAEGNFREAMTLFKSSGVPSSANCMLEIEAELGRMGSKNGVVWSERTPLNRMRIDPQQGPIRTQQSTTFIPM